MSCAVQYIDIWHSFDFVSRDSAANHTGLLTAGENTVVFVPMSSVVTEDRLNTLSQILDQEQSSSPLQQQQNLFLRPWLTANNVGTVEFIGWSKGFDAPVLNESYVTMLGVLVVCSSELLSF